METAIKAVEEGETVSQAAHDHGIPRTTLFNCISSRATHSVKPGPVPYLNNEKEKGLGMYLKHYTRLARVAPEEMFLHLFKQWPQRKVCCNPVTSQKNGDHNY